MANSADSKRIVIAWVALGGLLAALAGVLAAVSQHYWAGCRADRHAGHSTGRRTWSVPGSMFLLTLPLIRASIAAGLGFDRRLLMLMIGLGMVFRMLLFWSTPAFEDDWYRYLWDGAVTANGYNPYAVSPDEAQGEPYRLLPAAPGAQIRRGHRAGQPLASEDDLPARGAGGVRVGVSDQALEPRRMAACVLLLSELAALGLLIALLARGRAIALVGGALLVEPGRGEGDHQLGAHGGHRHAARAGPPCC